MSDEKPIEYHLFATDKFKTKYPEHFVNSPNDRYVSVIGAHAYYEITDESGNKTYIKPEYYQLHASFVQDDDSMDHYVCIFNHPLYHKRKYQQHDRGLGFEVWITDYSGKVIIPDDNLHIIIELLLEY